MAINIEHVAGVFAVTADAGVCVYSATVIFKLAMYQSLSALQSLAGLSARI